MPDNHLQSLEARRLFAADFNADGTADFLYRDTTTGQLSVTYLNEEGAAIKSVNLTSQAGAAWEIVDVQDFDRDSDADILWRNNVTGRVLLWRMNGNNLQGFTAFPNAPLSWDLQAVGLHESDADTDWFDLVWRNKNTGRTNLWTMQFNQVQRFVDLPYERDLLWEIAGVSDIRGNSFTVDMDIMYRNTVSGDNRVWRIENNRFGQSFLLNPRSTDWTVAGFVDADYDNGGDIVWRNLVTGVNELWEYDHIYNLRDAITLPANANTNAVGYIGDDVPPVGSTV